MITRRTLAASALAGLCVAPEPARAQAQAQCPPGYRLDRLEQYREGDTIYIRPHCTSLLPLCSNVPSSEQEITRALAGLRGQLGSNQREAQRLQDAVDEWIGYGEEVREETRKRTLGIGISAGLVGLRRYVQATRYLTLQQHGLVHREWGAVVDRLSRLPPAVKTRLRNRVSLMTTVDSGAVFFSRSWNVIHAAYHTGALAQQESWSEFKEAAYYTLSLALSLVSSNIEIVEGAALTNPVTAVFVADLRSVSNAGFGWWAALTARGHIRNFLAQQDAQLAEANREASRYVVLSDTLRRMRAGETYCITSPN